MTPSNSHRLSSISTEVNDDDHNHLHHGHLRANPPDSSSSSSLSYPLGFIPDQDHGGSFHWELNKYEEKNVASPCESCDHTIETIERKTGFKLTIKKRDYKRENHTDNGSSKWMFSKMRMTQKTMHTDNAFADIPQISSMKNEDQKQHSSSQETDNNSSIDNFSNYSNITVKVCADCHTTKTPLWRSGPRGPKSLCNACGIRQRKVRRAMAASTDGSIVVAETSRVNGKLIRKEKKSKTKCAPQFKKRCKRDTSRTRGRKKFCFEEFMMKLTNNMTFQQVFPQDEKEAAILLMSLSYGLVHG